MVSPETQFMRDIQQAFTGRRFAVLTVLLGGLTAFGPLSMDLYLPAFPGLRQTSVRARVRCSSR